MSKSWVGLDADERPAAGFEGLMIGSEFFISDKGINEYWNGSDWISPIDKFMSFGSDAPAIKMKKFTGTTAGLEGNFTNIAHGFPDISKIIGLNVLVTQISGNCIPPGFTGVGEFEYSVFVDATDIKVMLHPTNSGNILNKAVTVLITYEE